MKITLLLLLFVSFYSFSATAQKINCKDEKDPITGKRVIQSSYKDGDLIYKYEEGSDVIKVHWPIGYNLEQNTSFSKGAELVLKLQNGEIIKLYSINEAMPETSASIYGIVTRYTFIYDLTKEQLAKLASSPIVFSRYQTPTGGTKDEGPEVWGKRVQKIFSKLAQCIHDKIN